MVVPILDVDIGFLIQFTDGGSGYFAALQGFGDILFTAFPAVMPLYDGRPKGDASQAYLALDRVHPYIVVVILLGLWYYFS